MMMLTNDDVDAGHTPIRVGFAVSVTFAINQKIEGRLQTPKQTADVINQAEGEGDEDVRDSGYLVAITSRCNRQRSLALCHTTSSSAAPRVSKMLLNLYLLNKVVFR